jgi:hypothetical protein
MEMQWEGGAQDSFQGIWGIPNFFQGSVRPLFPYLGFPLEPLELLQTSLR